MCETIPRSVSRVNVHERIRKTFCHRTNKNLDCFESTSRPQSKTTSASKKTGAKAPYSSQVKRASSIFRSLATTFRVTNRTLSRHDHFDHGVRHVASFVFPCPFDRQERRVEEANGCDFASQLQLPFEPEPESDSLLLPAPLHVGLFQQASHCQVTSTSVFDSVQKWRLPRCRFFSSVARGAMGDLFNVPLAVSVCQPWSSQALRNCGSTPYSVSFLVAAKTT